MTNYTADQERMLRYCTYCPRLCHFSCPTALGDASESATAWGMVTLAEAVRGGDLALSESIAAAYYRCASCYRCQSFCRHGNDVPSILEVARSRAVEEGVAPPTVNQILENLERFGRPNSIGVQLPETPASEPGQVAFAPACDLSDVDAGSYLDRVLSLLERLVGEPVGLVDHELRCCGSLARRAGDPALAERLRGEDEERARRPARVVTDCSDRCVDASHDQPVDYLTFFLAERADALAELASDDGAREVIWHGGCRERRVLELEQAERRVLEALQVVPRAIAAIQDEPPCCGADPIYRAVGAAGAARAAEAVAQDAAAMNGGRTIVTSSRRCALHMRAGGADAVSVTELVLERCSIQRQPS